MKRLLTVALLVCFVLGALSLSALADDKLQRGGKNLVFGWTEIPKTITKVTKDTDNPFLGISVGLLKGIANAFSRTTSGAADVITLPVRSQQEPLIKEKMVQVGSSTK